MESLKVVKYCGSGAQLSNFVENRTLRKTHMIFEAMGVEEIMEGKKRVSG